MVSPGTALLSPFRHGVVVVSLVSLATVFSLTGLQAVRSDDGKAKSPDKETEDSGKPAPKLTRNWTVLHVPRRGVNGPIPQNSPLESLQDFDLEGARTGHPFLLGNFRTNGGWRVADGLLLPDADRNTALRLARAEDFDLEGIIDATGLGGWFLLVGWNERHGYGLYNVEMKESGSLWCMTEFRDAKSIPGTHGEIHRYQCRGAQPLRLSVVNRKVSLQIGQEFIARDLEFPNYHEGDIIVGCYQTRYGSKPLKIQSLRVRAR